MQDAGTTTVRLGALLLAIGALAASLPGTATAQASGQGGAAAGRSRVPTARPPLAGGGVVRGRPLRGSCADIAAMPTALAEEPAGRALIRFKKDIEDAAVRMGQRADTVRTFELRRMTEMTRDVDSLMRVLMQVERAAASGQGPRVIRLHGSDGTTLTINGQLARGSVEATVRTMTPQVAALVSEAGRLAQIRIPLPSGWMGVTLSQSVREIPTEQGLLTQYCEYPVVETVTPASPAEKAGIASGDTLLAYNGRDLLSGPINRTTLFVPNRTVRVRLRRDGRTRELPVVIGRTPPPERRTMVTTRCVQGQGCTRTETPDTTAFDVFVRLPMAGRELPPGMARTTYPAPALRPPAMPIEPMLTGTGMSALFGARLSNIDEEFSAAVGLPVGVLVTQVPAGSPAAEAGLRPGEVIREVNGVALRQVSELRRAVERPGVRELRLTVSGRSTPARVVIVRW